MIDNAPESRSGAWPRTIAKEEINELPLCRFTECVHLVTTGASLRLALRELQQESVLGFDTESRPAFKKGQSFPVSLVQLAGEHGVYLFPLGALGGLSSLVPLLENPKIVKAGVALRDDLRRLRELCPFEAGGFCEISDLTRTLGVENTGLRSLAAIFLGCRISKGAQLTNWAKRNLTRKQIIYAATDAWISRELYLRAQAHVYGDVAEGEPVGEASLQQRAG